MTKVVLPFLSLLFACLSLVMLKSIYPQGVFSQFFAFTLGFITYGITSSLPFSFWKKWSILLFILVCTSLVFTFALGKTTNGSTRWIAVGTAQFQPSQATKPILALYLCTLLYSKKKKIWQLVFALLPIFLVFIQPDLGTALILLVITFLSLYTCGISARTLGMFVFLMSLFGTIGWTFVFHDYQKQRLFSFLAPASDTLGQGYHAQQAIIAVGSGKFFGRGLGHGVQSSLRFLPERQTDFMFASYAEELGFVGVLLLFLLYLLFFFSLIHLSFRIHDPAGKGLALTIVGALSVQTMMNIGMNIGLLPIAGVTLPLLSLGGSSIVSIFFALGLLASAYKANRSRHLVEIRGFV
ncbi:MAG: FtsW/RodA/SpoVE family cell cycle protein [Candidatus Pacebacteria bacterium]|nr:FtsW/RodA/SpoVE family cell cycle protein [Candidatus Paceibacterota bacterium]